MYIISRLKLQVKKYFQRGIKKPSNLAGLKNFEFRICYSSTFYTFSVGFNALSSYYCACLRA